MASEFPDPMKAARVSTTPQVWFVRGFLVGMLASAVLNAASYFVRSDGWGDLVGVRPHRREALGFPLEVWEEGQAYNGFFVDYSALLINSLAAAALSCLCGLAVWALRQRGNLLVAYLEQRYPEADRQQQQFQFSLRGLLLSTAVVAVAATILRRWTSARPEVLAGIYLLGPWLLVGLALLPRRISWQQRVGLIVPLTLLLIVVAIGVGGSLQPRREFDQVLLGIFICWTPQSAAAAAGLTAVLLFVHRAAWLGSQATRGGAA
jgi:hypothetical protein